MTLVVSGSGVAEWAPGSMLISLANGTPSTVLTMSIDGSGSQPVTLNPTGAQSNVTVMIPNLAPGSHTLTISGADSATFPFTVSYQQASLPSTPTSPTPSSPTTAGKWQLQDPVDSSIYVFSVNPSTATGGFAVKSIEEAATTTGQALSSEGTARPGTITLTGYTRTQAEHDALALWVRKPHRTWLTDDFGRVYTVVFTSFSPSPLTPRRAVGQPYLTQYTMTADVFS